MASVSEIDRRIDEISHLLCITSRQNARVSDCAKLTDRKHRKATGRFRFDGVKLTVEALRAGAPLQTIFLRASNAAELLQRIADATGGLSTAEHLLLEDSLFDRLSEENAPEGIICICEEMPLHRNAFSAADLSLDEHIVVLEQLRDPSNLGAVIRSAAAFGVDTLIISEDCADIYNSKTVRASMGTLFSQKIVRVPDIPEVIGSLRSLGRRTLAAALDRNAMCLGSFETLPGDCVIIGNEGHGLRRETIEAADACVYIPMTDRAESLNAAVAAAVLMWQFRHAEKTQTNAKESERYV